MAQPREPVLLPLPGEDLQSWAGILISVLQPVIAHIEQSLDILSLYDVNGREVVGPNGVNIYSATGRVILAATGGFAIEVADLATSLQLFLVPSGAIITWSGSIASIPPGWVLCDGSGGTPDLRDRFILGAGSSYPVATTGGSENVTLSASMLASHTHSYVDAAWNYTASVVSNGISYSTGTATFTAVTSVTLNSSNITASKISGSTGAGASIDIRPKYYALAYIMKT